MSDSPTIIPGYLAAGRGALVIASTSQTFRIMAPIPADHEFPAGEIAGIVADARIMGDETQRLKVYGGQLAAAYKAYTPQTHDAVIRDIATVGAVMYQDLGEEPYWLVIISAKGFALMPAPCSNDLMFAEFCDTELPGLIADAKKIEAKR